MAKHQLILPKMGESVSEATIIKWLKQPGDRIEEDESVLEIATDKVDSDVPSPVAGILMEQMFAENDVVQVGQILANIETEADRAAAKVPSTVTGEQASKIPGIDQLQHSGSTGQQENIPAKEQTAMPTDESRSGRFYSPLVKNIASQEGISAQELEQIAGTGLDGRVTKQDVLDYLGQRNSRDTTEETINPQSDRAVAAPVPSTPGSKAQAGTPGTPVIPVGPEDEIMEMDRMRRLISDHMVQSVHVSPHVCSIVEADVTNLVNWRNKIKDAFEKREGTKITLTPIFIEAVTKAIKDFPMINVSVDGYKIIKRKNINIGMATALPTGNLIVPVIKQADQLSLVGLSKSVNDLATRARSNKLRPDDTQGGTFTLTNIGAFGNLMGTPIINQPQVAIMAVGTITKKPAVIETEYGDMIGVRQKMYLSLSYDHRVVDGALGGMFVRRVADYLENWDTNREV